MKVSDDGGRRAQVYAIVAEGNTLSEAVCNGLDQACEAVDKIAEGLHRAEKPASYHVLDIVLRCTGADLLGAEATAYWAQAEPNLEASFPRNSLVFWAVVAKLPGTDPEVLDKTQAFFARIDAQNAEMEYSQFRCSDAYLLGEFEAMMLAAANRQYLPCYTTLLRHWNMSDGSREQYDTINELALAHGPCPEVDDLIATRLTEAPGQHGFDQFRELLPKIVEWYGDPLESPIYKCAAQKMERMGVTDHSGLQEVFGTDFGAAEEFASPEHVEQAPQEVRRNTGPPRRGGRLRWRALAEQRK